MEEQVQKVNYHKYKSIGSQILGFPTEEYQNWWTLTNMEGGEEHEYLKQGNYVRLKHLNSGLYLAVNYAGSAMDKSHYEVSLSSIGALGADTKNSLFKINKDSGKEGVTYLKSQNFYSFIDQKYNTAIFSSDLKLPEWGDGHNAVSATKDIRNRNVFWKISKIFGEEGI